MLSSDQRIRCALILAFFVTWSSHHQAAAKPVSVSIPFVSSSQTRYVTERDQYCRFRIPSLIVTPDGSLLAFAEGRRGRGGDPRRDKNAPMDLVMRRSTDNGRTWEALVVIDSGFRPDGGLVDFCEATPVLDEMTGTVFLFYGQMADFGADVSDYGQSPDADAGHHLVWVRSSTDNGKTWSDRKQIFYPDAPHETKDKLYWRMAQPGPGIGIQLRWQDHNKSLNGRLVVPAKRMASKTPKGEATFRPFVYYSDDHGESWQVGNVTGGPEADEAEVVELTDGTLLLDARQNTGVLRRQHHSRDAGETWGPHHPNRIVITPVDVSLMRMSARRDGHDRDRILFSGPRGIGRILDRDHDEGDLGLTRNDLMVWTSYNEGKTFINPVCITREMAAYSAMHRLADGAIGLLVESGSEQGVDYGDITFYRFAMAVLEDESRWAPWFP